MKNKLVYGIGYYSVGKYKPTCKGLLTPIAIVWKGMFKRCYTEEYPTYIGCSVDERWHNFQVFAEWFENNYVEGWHLDKDILFKGNKIYSPETCCFVPQEINKLFTKSNSKRGIYPIGVTFNKSKKLFESTINIKSKQKFLGNFSNIEEAFKVYKIAKEYRIKEIASAWMNILPIKVYKALVSYEVEITD